MSGTITSGIGLISGLPIQAIIDNLIAIESRPLVLFQNRVQQVQAQRAALAELSARLLALKNTITRFDETGFFRASKASSSDESVLTAVADENAALGTFQFQVRSLVSNNQLIGRGFADTDRQPVGVGTLSIEIGHGRLDHATSLAELNGGDGVRRGSIEITDSTGAHEIIDLTTVLTVQDVLAEINSRTDIAVTARVEDDHLVIEDRDGGNLGVRDVGGGHAAEDLGIAQTAAGGVIQGDPIIYVGDGTQLSVLNDGNGVSIGVLNTDIEINDGTNTFVVGLRGLLTRHTHFDVLNNGNGVRNGTMRITNRAGQSADIVIDDNVQTAGDLIDVIESSGIDISVAVGAAAGQFVITDNSTPGSGEDPGTLKIEDVSGHAAADLGIVVDTDQTTFTGSEIHRVSTVGDVIRAINYAVDASDAANVVRNQGIVARIGSSGRGIELESVTNSDFTLTSGHDGSRAAEQLGLIGDSTAGSFVARDVLAGLNSVLLTTLRGGRGIDLGEVKFQDAAGFQVNIHFSNNPPSTVLAFIDRVNAETAAANVAIRARLNDMGTGVVFEDSSGGSGITRLKDVGSSGSTIKDFFDVVAGMVQTADGELDTGNTQLQYISEATLLSKLNNGRGIATGSFTITASSGARVSININENQKSVGDVLALIRAIGGAEGIDARINDNGDGIEILDTAGGAQTLSIIDESSGRTARDLNIAGQGTSFDDNGQTHQRIDGSVEYQIEIDADDTLDDVRRKIKDLGIDVGATIVNDGSDVNPYHLVVNSEISGTDGRLTLDTGSTNLSFSTLVEAQDAVVFFGGSGAENPIVLTSSTNTLRGVLDNVTINLVGTSDSPVELSIAQDIDRIVDDLSTFVSSFNGVLDSIDQHTSFNPDTNERGLLFGDSTVTLIQGRLRSVVNTRVPQAPPGLDRLLFVGVRVGSGGRLSFDEEKFRELYAENPEGIEALFTTEEFGLGDRLETMLDDLTRAFDGLLTRRVNLLSDREELFNERIAAIEELLARKRQRLTRQFQGLENSLASLQGAQSAIGVIASLAGTNGFF